MARYAVIKNDEIVNTIVWDGIAPISVDSEVIEIPSHIGTGDKKINGKWHRASVTEEGEPTMINLEPEIQMMAAPKATKKKK